MRIIIDIQGMQSSSRARGIGRYTEALVQAILKENKEHEIFLLLNGLFSDSISSIHEKFRDFIPEHHFLVFQGYGPVDALKSDNHWRKNVSELCREKLIEDISPDFVLISSLFEGAMDNTVTSVNNYTQSIPTAVILYDLIPHMAPEKYLAYQPLYDWYYEKIDHLKKASLLLAISESARQEAIEHLNFREEKVVTISSAVNNKLFRRVLSEESFNERFDITKPYLMHTSAYEKRKNFEGLIEAFSMLTLELRHQYQLVLVCKLNEIQRFTLESVVKKFGLSNKDVILTGFVSDEELIILYSNCYLFVFPSLHEGFGLPPLEAMSCGAATIGSNTSSIPEVIDMDTALFDPTTPNSISKKIEGVLTNKQLWEELKEHALVQSKKFSWATSAKIALKALKQVYTKNPKKSIKTNPHQNTKKLLNKIASLPTTYNAKQNELMHLATIIESNEKVIQKLSAYADFGTSLKWRIEGPFDSSYSLALLNRETARAVEELGHTVILHSTEGPGDFPADKIFLQQNLDLMVMNSRVNKYSQQEVDIVSRNLYPPRVKDMQGRQNLLHHYAWEETAFPQEWVGDFNSSLQGITCLSKHVKKVMLDNGVTVPLSTSGCGIDHWQRIITDKQYKLPLKQSFKFLHVSSCFPRKGADVLLKSYGEAFNADDDVILVIKTFDNPHNELEKWLSEAKKENPNYPDVYIIKEDLLEEELKALYEKCDAMVGPSRAEGFGLPFAEAMLSGLPVITTGWSGQLDFCNDETAWLIDYEFTPAKTHFELFNSVWAEPSQKHLSILMREVYELPLKQRKIKPQQGRKLLLKEFKWKDVASHLVNAALEFSQSKIEFEPKIAWITTWNTKCGIATYSKHLIKNISSNISILASHTEQLIAQDTKNVYRCWNNEDNLQALSDEIDRLNLNTIIVQFNYGFFDFNVFKEFIKQQKQKSRTIVIMLHATQDPINRPLKKLKILIESFQKCSRLLVHSHGDLNRLKNYGLLDNVALFPHGILDWKNSKPQKNKTFTIASYGFFLPHKGLLELIEAISLLIKKGDSIKLNLINAQYPIPESEQMVNEAKEKIKTLHLLENIELNTDFLPDEESLMLLNKADLLIFPYQETGESSSAAVRYGLATGKPVIVTPLAIFDDVDRAVFKLPGTSINNIAEGLEIMIKDIQNNQQYVQEKKTEADKWRNAHKYSSLGSRLKNILYAVKGKH